MSEYQYYEFQAVDRPLDAEAKAQLRAISSRARISSVSFVNSYDWGDLKADPLDLLARYFDLFVYVANWGTRWFAMRVPRRLLDIQALQDFGFDDDPVLIQTAGEHAIISIVCREIEDDEWDDGSGWLEALAPLRADLLGGDMRLFSLLWLLHIEHALVADDAPEPAPGIGPLDGALESLAEFLCLDPDLVEAAAARPASPSAEAADKDIDAFLRSLPDAEKLAFLRRAYGNDRLLSAELQQAVRRSRDGHSRRDPTRRTVSELRAAAERFRDERERREKQRAEAERRWQEEANAKARAEHLAFLAKRAEWAWSEVETQIEARNAHSYDRATTLLVDLRDIAAGDGRASDFARRIAELSDRHARKGQFIRRLQSNGLWPAPAMLDLANSRYRRGPHEGERHAGSVRIGRSWISLRSIRATKITAAG
jgi:hypothetical protein